MTPVPVWLGWVRWRAQRGFNDQKQHPKVRGVANLAFYRALPVGRRPNLVPGQGLDLTSLINQWGSLY